jgi:hypothetical protein
VAGESVAGEAVAGKSVAVAQKPAEGGEMQTEDESRHPTESMAALVALPSLNIK